MKYKIDILLLTYNKLDTTKKCIEHIYKHTNHNFRLFIVDNKSIDVTVEYLKLLSIEKNNLYINFQRSNLGIIKGRNFCYKFSKEEGSKSKYFIFLDTDQMVQPGWLDSYLDIFDRGYDILGIEAWRMRDKDFYPYKKITNPLENFSYVGGGGLSFNKRVIKNSDKVFDERFSPKYFEDPDFIFRKYQENFKIGWNYNPVIIHNHSGPLLNKNDKVCFINNWKKFQKKWQNFNLPIFKMK